jgi:hypothetical protein
MYINHVHLQMYIKQQLFSGAKRSRCRGNPCDSLDKPQAVRWCAHVQQPLGGFTQSASNGNHILNAAQCAAAESAVEISIHMMLSSPVESVCRNALNLCQHAVVRFRRFCSGANSFCD